MDPIEDDEALNAAHMIIYRSLYLSFQNCLRIKLDSKKKVLQRLKMLSKNIKYHEIDRSGVVELCRCTPNHASWLLRQLTESGYLKRVGNGRGAKYHLAEKKL